MNTTASRGSIQAIYKSYVENSRIDMQGEDANVYVARALRLVIETVLTQLSATLVVTISTRELGTAQWFEYVINNLVDSWHLAAVQLLSFREDRPPVRVSGRKRVNLLLVDSYAGLLDTNITEDNADFDDLDYYFIFLQARDRFIPQQKQLILDHCLNHYWLNCNVMIQTAQVEVLVYTFYPYTANRCQRADPVLVNQFDGRQWMQNGSMFPDKLDQMHGCPLTVLTWHQPPFVALHWDPNSEELQASGFEIQLLEYMSQQMNFSVHLSNLSLLRPEKYYLAEGKAEGPLEILLQRRANLSLGYFRQTARRKKLLTTPMSYYSANLVAIVSLERYRLGPLALLVFPFDLTVWLLLLSAVTLHTGLQILRRQNGLQIWALLLGASVGRWPRPWRFRIIASHWLWASIPLRVTYQSLLFHLIRLQLYESPPLQLDDLIGEGYQAVSTANTQRLIQEVPQVAQNRRMFHALDAASDWEVLASLQRDRYGKIFGIVNQDVSQSYLQSFASMEEDAYHVLRQPVNVEYVGMYMPKHSYMYAKVDETVRRLDAGGFILAWRRAAFNVRRWDSDQEQMSRQLVNHTKLSGIYIVLAGMYLLSGILFAGEVLLHRRNQNAQSRR
ncbi:uncharacterized protein Dana_GF28132 [Drosophila ananassae]|uniref:Putative ionotropic receptor ligand binding domain-containing protein n=1 Tax=Drosophila ananassae TaxID=7217 RepID=A0A0P8XJS0_DROAN|nr:uncharacterized protein LOC26515541 [Drosophila ananassae]KPU75073.1 uncharacterized protein Dana_GF28132 [Drosophila ananassae]